MEYVDCAEKCRQYASQHGPGCCESRAEKGEWLKTKKTGKSWGGCYYSIKGYETKGHGDTKAILCQGPVNNKSYIRGEVLT